jgi:hypothetical protein
MAIACFLFLAAWLLSSSGYAQVTRGVNLGGWLVTEEWLGMHSYRADKQDHPFAISQRYARRMVLVRRPGEITLFLPPRAALEVGLRDFPH